MRILSCLALVAVFAAPVHAAPVTPETPAPIDSLFATDILQAELLAHLDAGEYAQVLQKTAEHDGSLDATSRGLRIAAQVYSGDLAAAESGLATFKPGQRLPVPAAWAIAEAYLAAGYPELAGYSTQLGLMERFDSSHLLFLMGRLQLQAGRSREAARYLQAAAALPAGAQESFDRDRLRDTTANLLLTLNQPAEALALFNADTTVPVSPTTPVYAIASARNMASDGRFEAADSAVATDIRGYTRELAVTRAQIKILAGQPEAALALLDAPTLGTADASILLTRSLAHMAMSQPEAAARALLPLGPAATLPPALQPGMAMIALGQGDVDAVLAAMQRAPLPLSELARLPALPDHLQNTDLAAPLALAYFAFDQGYHRQSLELLDQALQAWPEHPLLLLLRAENLRQMGHYTATAAALEDALHVLPGSAALRLLLATAQEAGGDDEAALTSYRVIIEAHPDFVLAQLALTRLYTERGEHERAQGTCEWALNFKPDSPALLAALAWALAEQGKAEESRATLRALQRVAGSSAQATISHINGYLALQAGDLPAAAKDLYSTLRLGALEPRLLQHLARLHEEMGHPEAASNLARQTQLLARHGAPR